MDQEPSVPLKINLANKRDREVVKEIQKELCLDPESLLEHLHLANRSRFSSDRFRTSEEPALTFGRIPLFLEDSTIYSVKDNRVYKVDFPTWSYSILGLKESDVQSSSVNADPVIFIVPNRSSSKKHNNRFLVNADDGVDGSLSGFFDARSNPTLSFKCLQRFYDSEAQLHNSVKNQHLHLLDFTPEKREPLSQNLHLLDFTPEKREPLSQTAMNRKNQMGYKQWLLENPPPASGFSLVRNAWHQAATTLLYDQKAKMCLLFGQDEGSYFGVQLKNRCSTIKEAFLELTPKQVRGKSFLRQGEWFVVEVSEDELPDICSCVLVSGELFRGRDFHLKIDSPESNRHILSAHEMRVTESGQIYARGATLVHSQHHEVGSSDDDQWVTFYRNTAVRSFSEEGVD